MSDIYLQITETPTVVTLSAPVISGALSSTVTVANVVTVALDSNSLSALENVTVTVGAAITGTVTVSNFPAFPASQAVTFGQAIVSASNITGLNNSVGTDGSTPASTSFIKIGGHQDGSNSVEHIVHVSAGGAMKVDASDSTVTFGAIRGTVTIGNTVTIAGTVTANPTGTQTIAGTVTANVVSSPSLVGGGYNNFQDLIGNNSFSVYGNVDIESINSALPAGTNRIGVVTIGNIQRAGDSAQSSLFTEAGSGYLLNRSYLGAGSEQIGSVTASISGTVPISISSVTVGNSVTIGSLPAISGTVTANTFALQGTAVTTSNFTSTTASTVLASFNATREVLTIFNEGAGNLFVSVGATCTTAQYQVRLSSGDYYEVPNHQTTITHSAVFATAGTARVTEVS
jgi:hypothetical protein